MDYETFAYYLQRALQYDARPNGLGADSTLGPTLWERLNHLDNNVLAISDPDVDYDALARSLVGQGIKVVIIDPAGAGGVQTVTTTPWWAGAILGAMLVVVVASGVAVSGNALGWW